MGIQREQIPLLVVCGPTASGKTRLAIDLAKGFSGEVVSADSMQIYRAMDIGTAKPTPAEQDGVPHHLLDVADPGQSFSLVDYLSLAHKAIEDIAGRGRLPILTGGTGLYILSLVDNIQFDEIATDPELRLQLMRMGEVNGEAYLWERLRECDPVLAGKLHPNNQGRIIRALEVFTLTGIPMSELQRRSRLTPSPYKLCMLGLYFARREALYDRIDRRVDVMLEAGLLEEVRELRKGPLSPTAAQAIGYKELFAYLDGQGSLDDAVNLIKTQSRRYAKRQMTWLRRDARINWLEWGRFEAYPPLLQQAAVIAVQLLQLDWKGAQS